MKLASRLCLIMVPIIFLLELANTHGDVQASIIAAVLGAPFIAFISFIIVRLIDL